MSIYRYPEASLIKEVTFHYSKDHPPVAFLEADDKASLTQIFNIRRALEKGGLQCVPVYLEGKNVLQVEGFEKAWYLDKFLRQKHFTAGKATITLQSGDDVKRTAKDWLKYYALPIAGALNLIGDVSFLWAGIKQIISPDPKETKDGRTNVLIGSFYTFGGLEWLFYGNTPTEYYARHITERTAEYLKGQNGELPSHSNLAHTLRNKRSGLWSKTELFLRNHPSEITLAAYSTGALSALGRGIAHYGESTDAKWNAWYGACSTSVKIGAIMVPESKKDDTPEGTKKKQQKGFIGWIKEKPMRIFGYGSLLSEVILTGRAYSTFKAKGAGGSFLPKALGAAAYAASDGFAAIANKDHTNAGGILDDDQKRRIEAMSAEALLTQPEEALETKARNTGKFLAKAKEVGGNADTIGQSIIEQAKHMKENPWAIRSAREGDAQIKR